MDLRVIAAGVLAAAGAACAQSWGTFGDFSLFSNPGGPWSYGWLPGGGGSFTLFDRQVMLGENLAGWTGTQFPDNAPIAAINPTASPQPVPQTTIIVPAQAAWARPGAGGESAVFRFTAPYAGSYTINGVFRQIDPGGSATHISVRIRGNAIMGIDLPISGAIVMDPSPPIQLAGGDTIEFIVGPGAGTSGSGMEVEGHISRAILCYPNCDQSTAPPILNIADFACFLNLFAAGDHYANCDGSTQPPILTVNDFSCFLNRFAAGCP